MRTLQEKYNAIQEGKFSKDQFLVEARMQHPNLVTRFNGYDDAVQILKNKGMITESLKDSEKTYKGLRYIIYYKAPKGYFVKGVGELSNEIAQGYFDTEAQAVEHAELEIDGYLGDDLEEINEARLTKNSLTDYRYKPTNDMDKYPYEQILRGLRVELEGLEVHGTPTPEEYKKALAKVLKNLEKDEIFYTNQLAGNNKKVDLHDKMADVTTKNTVDTFNGMKKVKDLKEDHSKNPDDKYVVRPCKNKKEPWAVWEGETRVKGFATKEQAKEYADKQNKKQGLTESVLKEGIKNLIKKALMENEEDVYEMQGPKTDAEYKRELEDYLEDNQIYGYTNKIHDIMTGPDEDEASRELAEYLEDNQIYGYTRAIESIYADYPYDQHWMNQPDEDEIEEAVDTEADKNMVRKLMAMYETEPSKFERVHKQAQVQADTTKDIKAKHLVSLFDRAKAGALQSLANQDRFEADREGMSEVKDDRIQKAVEKIIAKFINRFGEISDETRQEFEEAIKDDYEDNLEDILEMSLQDAVEIFDASGLQLTDEEDDLFESVSLKDLL